jgi:hypothetical protein
MHGVQEAVGSNPATQTQCRRGFQPIAETRFFYRFTIWFTAKIIAVYQGRLALASQVEILQPLFFSFP